jgi:hypothetical protein
MKHVRTKVVTLLAGVQLLQSSTAVTASDCSDLKRVAAHVLRCDIYRYFPAIDHAALKSDFRRRIICPPTLALLDSIVDGSNAQEPVYLYRAPVTGVRKPPRHAGWYARSAVPRAPLWGFKRRACRVHASARREMERLRGAKHGRTFTLTRWEGASPATHDLSPGDNPEPLRQLAIA